MEQKEYEQIVEDWKLEHKEEIESSNIRKIFLDILPTGGLNRGNRINWINSVGYKVKGIYNSIEFEIKIKSYNLENNKITVSYIDKEMIMNTGNFIKCKLGNLLGEITSDFKIELGTRYQDEKRDITIIDRKIDIKTGRKYYKYYCNICHFDCGKHWSTRDKEYKEELWISESNLNKNGCACCCSPSHVVVEGINDIPTVAPWLISYFQGGYDEAKKFTRSSGDKIYPICPDCLRVKNKKMIIKDIYNYHSIGCTCSNKIPYPEKFMFSVLEQLVLDFQTQLTKTTFKWCNNYRYDFYFELNGKNYIIETHGLQHYEDAWDKLEKTQENDKNKKELALSNGIEEENYIVIDCRRSELKWIKNSILIDETLNNLFDLSKIDWKQCEEFALSSLVNIACEYKTNNPDLTATEIAILMKYSQGTIISWLKQGNEVGWCNYDAKREMINNNAKIGKANGKTVEIFKDEISLGIFPSCSDLERQSEKLFGVKLCSANISSVCTGKLKQYKGYKFRHVLK